MTTEAKTESKTAAAAYIPWKSLITSTQVLEQGLPRRLDRSVFTTFSGSMRSWLISAYYFLGFIDSAGNVQESLREWVGNADKRPQMMLAILRAKYPALMTLAAEPGTPQQMQKAFEVLGVTGTTAQRSIKFFIDACDFAGVPVPASWKKVRLSFKSTRSSQARRGSGITGNAGRAAKQEKDDDDDEPRGPGETVHLRSGGKVTMIIDANLMRLSSADRDWLFGLIDQFQQYVSDDDLGLPDGDDEDA